MRRQVVLITILAALIGLTAWITSLDKIGVYDVFSWSDLLTAAKDHLEMVLKAELLAVVIAVSLATLVTRPRFRWLATPVIFGGNVGQTLPSLAVIAIMAPLLGFGLNSAIVALTIYGLLPVLRNSYVGINNIQPAIVEAARGMGMTRGQIARKVELPLALPVIMAGIRISTVITVGTAELAVLVGGKGLGRITLTGVLSRQPLLILQGAAPTAAMAIILGFILESIERWMTPRGLRVEARVS